MGAGERDLDTGRPDDGRLSDLLTTFVDAAADEGGSTVADLTALLGLARRINETLLPEEVYGAVLDAAVELLDADSGSLRLRVGDLLAVAASAGDAPAVGTTYDLEDDPAVVVVTLGVDVVEEEPPRLALPVTIGHRHVGVLEVRRREERAPFTARSALLGRLLAEEAAAAVTNANRFDHLRSQTEELRSDRRNRIDAVADTVHDLRVPLSAILAWTELLRERFDDLGEGRQQEALDAIMTAATQLRGLVDDVFQSAAAESRAARGEERIELPPLLEEAVASARGATTADGTVDVQVLGDPVVVGDRDALRRVVTNLVANALEHGSSEVRVRCTHRRREVRIDVADRGHGIPAEELETLFRRRLRPDGSPRGRGLPIVDGLVRAMGGRVGVRSREGVGSVFTVVLPAADPPPL